MIFATSITQPFFSLWEPSVYRQVQLKDVPQEQSNSRSFAIDKITCGLNTAFISPSNFTPNLWLTKTGWNGIASHAVLLQYKYIHCFSTHDENQTHGSGCAQELHWMSIGRHQNSNLFVYLLNCLRVTHPAAWRSDGCSLQPAGSCSLQETHTKPHQRCERSVVRTDCISLSYLPRKLDTRKIHRYATDCRSRTRGDCIWNISHFNSL